MFYSEGFDLDIALELGQLINNAYQQYEQRDNDSQSQTWQPDGYTIRTTFKSKQNEDTVPFGFVAEKNSNVYIIFRGTRTASEWTDNAEINQTESQSIADWGESKTTAGFNDIYSELSPNIISDLKDLKKISAQKKIFVSGHSLGGALATLCVADILTKTNFKSTDLELYTFASPRTGNIEFATEFLSRKIYSWRIFNTEDIVPYLPLATLNLKTEAFGLQKFGEKFVANILEKVFNLPESIMGSDLTFQHIGIPIAITFQLGNIPDNHNLDKYLEILSKSSNLY
ncbi:MAG: lipase family protein [Dolichospermum sp. DET50]|nr:lipase family protein [Dolichospermum sp. DET66]MBS3033410.1 lipase family protein [Dolichospermum sp. DET67]MBS3038614.1 lipase family protein [Dolichospermum sp. DET50]QSX65896.1 MAG: lipase family protein [Dolichospermum sp. DET69]